MDFKHSSLIDACCHHRNACVQTCGSLKAVCEQDFLLCGETACQTLSNDDNDNDSTDEEKNQLRTCTQHMQLQKIIHSMDSCAEYAKAQTKNCQCLPSKEAPKARMEFLTQFYSEYDNPSEQQQNDDGDDNVNNNKKKKLRALAGKADTARKMSTLIGKLVKKYPQAIQYVEDPQEEYMERMMKDALEEENDNDDDGTGMEDLGVEEL
jgi:hypothetical protein